MKAFIANFQQFYSQKTRYKQRIKGKTQSHKYRSTYTFI